MKNEMKVHDLLECPACGSARFEPELLGSRELRRCGQCRLVFATSYADPSEVYVEGYLFGDTPFGLDLMHPDYQEFLAHCAHVRMGLIERVIGPDASLLDVGCGTGEVLAVARSRGWRTTGVEPVGQSASYASDRRGLDVIPTTLEESGLPERSFDVVSAFHVVEHMTDAVSFLRSLARWARPGGYVVVEVPNWRSVHRRQAGERWAGLRPLEHVAHYDPATLERLFARAGITPTLVRTPGFLYHKQTLDQQLDDLGLYRLEGRSARLGTDILQRGERVVRPRPTTAKVLLGLQSFYDRLGIGQVVLAMGQV